MKSLIFLVMLSVLLFPLTSMASPYNIDDFHNKFHKHFSNDGDGETIDEEILKPIKHKHHHPDEIVFIIDPVELPLPETLCNQIPILGDFNPEQPPYNPIPDDDYTFENVPVPEPATLLLLGTGLIGLAGFSRKKLIK